MVVDLRCPELVEMEQTNKLEDSRFAAMQIVLKRWEADKDVQK